MSHKELYGTRAALHTLLKLLRRARTAWAINNAAHLNYLLSLVSQKGRTATVATHHGREGGYASPTKSRPPLLCSRLPPPDTWAYTEGVGQKNALVTPYTVKPPPITLALLHWKLGFAKEYRVLTPLMNRERGGGVEFDRFTYVFDRPACLQSLRARFFCSALNPLVPAEIALIPSTSSPTEWVEP